MSDQKPHLNGKTRLAYVQEARMALERSLRTKRGQAFTRIFLTVMSLFAFVMGSRWLELALRPLPIDWQFSRFDLSASEVSLDLAPWFFMLSVVILANLVGTMMTGSLIRASRLRPIFVRSALGSALIGTLCIVTSGYFDSRFDRVEFVSMQAEGQAAYQLHTLTPVEHALLLTAVNEDFFTSRELTPRVERIANQVKQLQPYDQRMFQELLRASILGDLRRRAKVPTVPASTLVQRPRSGGVTLATLNMPHD